jgi:transcription elongation GreA/GreB family factor
MSAHKNTAAGVTHAEAKPENDKDTRALEQSYLARGQAERVRELEVACAETAAMSVRAFGDSPAALGALVTVSEDEREQTFFLAPHGGGTKLAGGAVHVVTPRAPIGRALVGKREGDTCTVVIAGKTREMEIVRVE